MSSNKAEKPFMGKMEFNSKDPDLEVKIEALTQEAVKFGSAVVRLVYDRRTLVFYGTNHTYEC